MALPYIYKYKKASAQIADLSVDNLTINESLTYTERTYAKEVSDATYTLSPTEDQVIRANPIDNDVTINLPVTGVPQNKVWRIETRYNGNGLIDRGDCESTTAPMVSGETTPQTDDISGARSTDFANAGTYSYKLTIDSSPASEANFQFTDTLVTASDLHGFVAGETYTFSLWMYIPTSGGETLTSISASIQDYDGASYTRSDSSNPTENDTWQKLSVTHTIATGATGARAYVKIDSATADAILYIDDVQLYQHSEYPVSIAGPINNTYEYNLLSDGDFVELTWNGASYDVSNYGLGWALDFSNFALPNSFLFDVGSGIVEQGSNDNGNYVVFSSGLQICWGTVTGVAITTSESDLFGSTSGTCYIGDDTHTFPNAFASDPYTIVTPLSIYVGKASVKSITTATTFVARLMFVTSSASGGQYDWIAIGVVG